MTKTQAAPQAASKSRPAKAGPTSGRLHEAERRRVRSWNADIPTTVRFANRSGARVRIYWLDYQGARKHYQTLDDGAQYLQKTFVTHPWLITDDRDNALGVYLPDAQERVITVSRRV